MIHIKHPRAQASIGANTFVVSGPSETKRGTGAGPPFGDEGRDVIPSDS